MKNNYSDEDWLDELEITTILDTRVPQLGRERNYGVPQSIVEAVAVLYRHRNSCSDDEVYVIDASILRLYDPWIRKRSL